MHHDISQPLAVARQMMALGSTSYFARLRELLAGYVVDKSVYQSHREEAAELLARFP